MTVKPDDIIEMVYRIPAETRFNSVFVCDHKTAMTLRNLTDADGRFLWSDGLCKGQDARLIGYPVWPDKRYAGLAFGPFTALPEEHSFIAQREPLVSQETPDLGHNEVCGTSANDKEP